MSTANETTETKTPAGPPAPLGAVTPEEAQEIADLEAQLEAARLDSEHQGRTSATEDARAEAARKRGDSAGWKAAAEAAKKAQKAQIQADEQVADLERAIRAAKVAAGIIPPAGWVYIASHHRWHAILTDGYTLGEPLLKDAYNEVRHEEWTSSEEYRVESVACIHGNTRRMVEVGGMPRWNTWRPPVVKPVRGAFPGVQKVIDNLCGGDAAAAAYLIGWSAAPIQYLAKYGNTLSMNVMPILSGPQGTGKNTYFGCMQAVYGKSNTDSLDQDSVEDSFSRAGFADKQFILLNEANSNQGIWDNRTQSKLKEWTTEETISIRDMHKQGTGKSRHFNGIVAGNGERTAKLDPSDRRHPVFHAAQALEKDEHDQLVDADIRALQGELKALELYEKRGREGRAPATPQLSAWCWHLHNLPEDQLVRPGQLYRTKARETLIAQFTPALESFFEALDQNGIIGMVKEWEAFRRPAGPLGAELTNPFGEGELWRFQSDTPGTVRPVDPTVYVEVLPSRLHRLYIEWCGLHGRREHTTPEGVFQDRAVERYGVAEGGRRRAALGGIARPRGVVLARVLLQRGARQQGLHLAA